MTYSAAVFGVSMYFNAEARIMKHDINKHLAHTERMIRQRENIRNNGDVEEIPIEDEE